MFVKRVENNRMMWIQWHQPQQGWGKFPCADHHADILHPRSSQQPCGWLSLVYRWWNLEILSLWIIKHRQPPPPTFAQFSGRRQNILSLSTFQANNDILSLPSHSSTETQDTCMALLRVRNSTPLAKKQSFQLSLIQIVPRTPLQR